MKARLIFAQHSGRCATCGGEIRAATATAAGDRIYWRRGEPPWHQDCAGAKQSHLAQDRLAAQHGSLPHLLALFEGHEVPAPKVRAPRCIGLASNFLGYVLWAERVDGHVYLYDQRQGDERRARGETPLVVKALLQTPDLDALLALWS